MGRLDGLKPEGVFHYFEQICAIPHGSGNEEALSRYCVEFARRRGLEVYTDAAHNVVIKKSASAGCGGAPGVILQGHLDMVCEKEEGCGHDFLKSGLDLEVSEGFISAKGTTLGGDDGVAVAVMLAALDDDSIVHPPLECVFTTGEEIGLLGASALEPGVLNGRRLINIDSEEEGVFTVGCAGGMRSECILPVEYERRGGLLYTVTVTGLLGGHSGTEIDKGRANSNILMGRLLAFLEKKISFGIAGLYGGNTDNAIASSTAAVLYVDEAEADNFRRLLSREEAVFREEYAASDPGIKISVEDDGPAAGEALTGESASRLIFMMHSVPDGVMRYSADMPGLVETSLNLGIMRLDRDAARLIFCVRSSVDPQKRELGDRLAHMAESLGGSYEEKGAYPGWKYRTDSFLRDTMVSVYSRMYGEEPEVVAIHAGLECGLFCEKIEELDCVSIGPDILDIHTPDERLSIESTGRVYEFVVEVLRDLCKG